MVSVSQVIVGVMGVQIVGVVGVEAGGDVGKRKMYNNVTRNRIYAQKCQTECNSCTSVNKIVGASDVIKC